MDVAVATGARAGVAEDLEGRGATPPALGDVRAARLLADGVEAGSVDQLADVVVARVGARCSHLHPLRTPGPLRDRKRALHARQSTRVRGLHRSASFTCMGWLQRPWPSSAGSSSRARSKTSSSAAAAAGR